MVNWLFIKLSKNYKNSKNIFELKNEVKKI